MVRLDSFQKSLSHQFKNPELLRLALTHPSISYERKRPLPNNQRLEFLGDAVLQMTISSELFSRFPDQDEGVLSKMRARLVSREALLSKARDMKLGPHLIMGRGEEHSGGKEKPSVLSDAYEAIIGAVFLDSGWTAARRFVRQQFKDTLDKVDVGLHGGNPKGELQELIQSDSSEPPDYRVLDILGPDHDRKFCCAVRHGGRELARGEGKSKQTAEIAAAAAAIAFLRSRGKSPPAGA
ncbi:MAG: ribonuclease III [Pedosphaera sp.]|nr:ribonuclease III [Pedosphaera sp.]